LQAQHRELFSNQTAFFTNTYSLINSSTLCITAKTGCFF
jgi:hypothetical protein